jgi:hypothetical protein
MYANQLGINLWRMAGLCVAMAVVAFALPAQSQVVVQYTGSIVTGFGDGPTIGAGDVNFDTANNGQPACQAIQPGAPFFGALGSATAAITGFVGRASVATTGPAPRAVQFAKQQGNGVTTHWSGASILCTSSQTQIPNFLTLRLQQTFLQWPGATGTLQAGGGFAGPTTAPFQATPTFNIGVQSVRATTITSGGGGAGSSPKFGGALRVNGVSNTFLGILTPGGVNVFQGTLPIKLFVGAQGGTATPTLQTTTGAAFTLKGGTLMTPVTAKQVFFPWTTGKVIASDRAGNFWTFRQRSGFDNRNSAGTTGTLQLVTPALTDIVGVVPLPFAITSVLTLKFLGAPEPGTTLLLGAGVVTLLGLCAAHRRRS